MSDKKITELPTLVSLQGIDLFMVIDDPNGTPTNKKIPVNNIFAIIPSNTTINGTLTTNANNSFGGSLTLITSNAYFSGSNTTIKNLKIASNGFIIANTLTPANSTVSGIPQGKIFYDDDYLYIRNSTKIRRIALEDF